MTKGIIERHLILIVASQDSTVLLQREIPTEILVAGVYPKIPCDHEAIAGCHRDTIQLREGRPQIGGSLQHKDQRICLTFLRLKGTTNESHGEGTIQGVCGEGILLRQSLDVLPHTRRGGSLIYPHSIGQRGGRGCARMTNGDIHRELSKSVGTRPVTLSNDTIIRTCKVEIHATWSSIESISANILYTLILGLLAACEHKPTES